ncbi:hypothetical protein [Halomarina ordinaria]|uniref:Uncharacterized protein n=1 Tax=Halomarina ordinaria TaxID=3033939 RepID=A0ABD5U9N0_9EURY|nr:hypothetical protein [Halomarina sp. PSRA2]
MTVSPTLASGVRFLRERGYDVTRPDDRGEPDALATPTPAARPLLDHLPDDERSVAIERLETVDPTTVVERVAGAVAADRLCAFVASAADAEAIRDVLTDPPLVVRETSAGMRTFYAAPDRIRLADRGFALCRRFFPEFRWEEVPVGEGAPRLVLYDDGEVVAVLDSTASLSCPPARAFPYSYARADDKRIHVADREGHRLASFPTIRAMKQAGYAPVPAPLVPEHVLDGRCDVADDWAVLVDEDGVVARALTDQGDGRPAA